MTKVANIGWAFNHTVKMRLAEQIYLASHGFDRDDWAKVTDKSVWCEKAEKAMGVCVDPTKIARENIDLIPSAEICKELKNRIECGEDKAAEECTRQLGDTVVLTAQQIAEKAILAEMSPDDIWPDEYVRADDGTLSPLIEAATCVAFDFDLDALNTLRHLLIRANVHNRFAATGAELALLGGKGAHL